MVKTAVQILICGVLVGQACAQDALGPTYPIREPDLLEDIQARLKSLESSGRLKVLQQEALKRSQSSIERPDPVKSVVRTVTPGTHYVDPSWRVPRDITTPSGELIARAGDIVNPLDYVPLSNHLLFFDQRDAAQVRKAAAILKHYDGKVKPILVAGEPLKLTRQWKQQVYFDQGGYLVRRFGIRQVPALVSQDVAMKRLRVDELKAD
jgi:conjugal transfer pilus assembly protein TraW